MSNWSVWGGCGRSVSLVAGDDCGLLAPDTPLGRSIEAALAEEGMVVFSGGWRRVWRGAGGFSVVRVVRMDGGCGCFFKMMLVSLADVAMKMGRKCGWLLSR